MLGGIFDIDPVVDFGIWPSASVPIAHDAKIHYGVDKMMLNML